MTGTTGPTTPYRQNVIDPVRGKADGWLNANASIGPIDANQPIDNGNLGFLLEVREGGRFATLMLQEDRFRYSAFIIGEHTRALLDSHKMLSQQGVRKGQGPTGDEMTAALGQELTMRLKLLLDAATKAVDENLASFQGEFKSLRGLGATLFQGAHFIDVEFKEVPFEIRRGEPDALEVWS